MKNQLETLRNRFVKQNPGMTEVIDDFIQSSIKLEQLMMLEQQEPEHKQNNS